MIDTLDPLPLRSFKMLFNGNAREIDHTQHATRLTLVYKHRMHISTVRSSAIVSAEDTGP